MKLFISVSDHDSNVFDYKVMFFLQNGFEVVSTSTSTRETHSGKNYLTLHASLTKEVSDLEDVEFLRRRYSRDLSIHLQQQRFDAPAVDAVTGEPTDKPGEAIERLREQLDEEILEFMRSNLKATSEVPERKFNRRTFNWMTIAKMTDEAVSRLVDDDKLRQFLELRSRARVLSENPRSLLLGPAKF